MTEQFLPVVAEIFVPDVRASVRWYVDSLGFAHGRSDPAGAWERGDPLTFAVLLLGEAHLLVAHDGLFSGPKPAGPRGVGIDIRIMVDDADAMYTRAKAAGVEIAHEIVDRPYGLRDFIIRDPIGFRIRFAAPLAADRAH